jgi:hypothetical protein
MLWDEVMGNAIIPMLEDDAELVGPTGLDWLYIFAAPASRPIRIPSVEWIIIGEQETEVFNPIDVQFDIYARAPELYVIERRIRARLTRDTRRTIAGINMSTLFTDSYVIDFLSQPGVTHKVLRYRLEPVRRRTASEY